MSSHGIRVTVNGAAYEKDVPARLTLADFLREKLDLTATHLGCEHGVCGACTVLVNDQAVRSCLMFAVQADGSEVQTLEGVSPDVDHPVQVALWEKHGMQCGFCTPGIVMTVIELLDRYPNPGQDQILDALGGCLCRCTGYVNIIEAVEEAVRLSAR